MTNAPKKHKPINIPAGAFRRWTQQAKACWDINGDCSKCLISKTLETRCVMKFVVKELYKKFGTPPEYFTTQEDFQDVFMSKHPPQKGK